MPNGLVDALHTNPDSARWPILDRLIDLYDAGLIGPESCRTALLETVVPPLVEPKD